jgi:alkylation response protein AidB-like acyl-CoA dehydrogenase
MNDEVVKNPTQSGAFLLQDTDPSTVFVPEHFDAEEKMIGDTVEKFVEQSVLSKKDAIDNQEEGLLKSLIREAGELGVFMVDVPEQLGGLGATKKAVMRVAEKLGVGGSFGPASLVHAGIGGLPIVFFGNDAQREKYLPGIMNGELVTAYALTETESGSDALAARSTATWDEAKGVYILNGSKQFITNAGFADLHIIFAKVDGKHFTCFILEDGMEGFSTGVEEKKMGLPGSSTRSLIFENVPVPKENVLGEIGKGHRIAFNVLNIGRLKLAPAVVGGMKRALRLGVEYAKERKQFGKPLSDFGLIQQKLAEAAVLIYCTESMCYRSAAMIDDHIAALRAAGTADPAEATVKALREMVIECSVNKVYASECMDKIVDEMLQVHGGYGYVQEYPIEGAYRDSRINRIWEGTSEINRMIITGTLMDRAMKGTLPLLPAVKKISEDLMSRRGRPEPTGDFLGEEKAAVDAAKKITLFASGFAGQKFLTSLQEQQEILAWAADLVMQTFAMESAWLRTVKLSQERGGDEMEARAAAVRLAVENGFRVVEESARRILAASAAGEELRSVMSMLKKLTRREPFNLVEAGRRVAAYVVEREAYPFV